MTLVGFHVRRRRLGTGVGIVVQEQEDATELQGVRKAHDRDGVALSRFLFWLSKEAPKGNIDGEDLDVRNARVLQQLVRPERKEKRRGRP